MWCVELKGKSSSWLNATSLFCVTIMLGLVVSFFIRIELNWNEWNNWRGQHSVHDDYIIGVCYAMYKYMYVVTNLLSASVAVVAAAAVATPVFTQYVDVVSGMLFSSSFVCSHRIKTYDYWDINNRHIASSNNSSNSTLLIWTRFDEQVKPTEIL